MQKAFSMGALKNMNYLDFFANVRPPPPHFGKNSQMIPYLFATPLIEQIFGANFQAKSGMDTMVVEFSANNYLWANSAPISTGQLSPLKHAAFAPCILQFLLLPLLLLYQKSVKPRYAVMV